MHRSKVAVTIGAVLLAALFAAILLTPGPKTVLIPARPVAYTPADTAIAPSQPPLQARLPSKHALRILFVGDSLRAGFYATRKSLSYPQLVARAVRRRGHQVTVLDATQIVATGDGFRRAASVKQVPDQVDLAVVEVGTNDVNKTALPDFRRDYRHLVAMIRRTSPRAKLLCLGVWQKGPPLEAFRVPYNYVIASECRGGQYVAITQLALNVAFHGPEHRKTFAGPSDTFHPNDAGHRAIAATVLDHLG